jgi:hypothetical protein
MSKKSSLKMPKVLFCWAPSFSVPHTNLIRVPLKGTGFFSLEECYLFILNVLKFSQGFFFNFFGIHYAGQLRCPFQFGINSLFFFLKVTGWTSWVVPHHYHPHVLGFWSQGRHPEPLQQPFFVMSIFEIGSHKLFARLASNWDPSDLCLLSS